MTGSFVVRRRSHRICALIDASTLRAAAMDVAAVVFSGVFSHLCLSGCPMLVL